MIQPVHGQSSEVMPYSGFVVVDAPRLKMFGIKYSMGGSASSRQGAIRCLAQVVARRNMLAPTEKMRLIPESVVWPADHKIIEEHRVTALKTIPRGMAAMELGIGRFLNQSIESLLQRQTETTDISRILSF